MTLYNTQIDFSSISHTNKNIISMIEDSSINTTSFDYSLEFYNNQYREIELFSNMDFSSNASNKKWIFRVKNIVSFAWNDSEEIISYKLYEEGSMELLKYWLSHIVFPIYLTLKKNYYILHVGAVVLEDKPVIFMANSHGGKSTLTNYFLQKDHALITDDKLGTFKKQDIFYCISSHPFHRPYRGVETLGVLADNFDTKVRKLENIYVLEKADATASIEIVKIKGIEKLRQLRYGSELNFSFLFEHGMKYVFALLSQIQIYKIVLPWDLDRLEEVYQAIVQHQKKLKEEGLNHEK